MKSLTCALCCGLKEPGKSGNRQSLSIIRVSCSTQYKLCWKAVLFLSRLSMGFMATLVLSHSEKARDVEVPVLCCAHIWLESTCFILSPSLNIVLLPAQIPTFSFSTGDAFCWCWEFTDRSQEWSPLGVGPAFGACPREQGHSQPLCSALGPGSDPQPPPCLHPGTGKTFLRQRSPSPLRHGPNTPYLLVPEQQSLFNMSSLKLLSGLWGKVLKKQFVGNVLEN